MLEIKIDSREQKPLEFNSSIANTTIEGLKTGDYTLKGLEDILCIERKQSLTEFYGNVSEPRFWREMERMKDYKYRFLVLEFNFDDINAIPYSLDVPKYKWPSLKIKSGFIIKCIGDIQVKYGVHVIFAGNRESATEQIINIMKRVSESQPRTD